MPSTTVTGITAASAKSGPLKAGDVVTFTLDTSGPVSVTGAPRLVLSNGGFASYAGIDGSGRPVFTYSVAAGDANTNALSATGLDTLNGAINGPVPQMKFAAATSVGVGSGPASVAVADVNGDGKPDLLAANSGGSTVSVRLALGGGVFSGSTNIAVGSNPTSVVVADVNGDGKLDLLAANFGSDNISVCIGDGRGGFSGPTNVALSAGSGPSSVVLGDVNGDGKLDLLAANFNANTVSVRLGKGDGTFTGAAEIAVGANPNAVAVSDLNGDGKLDLLTANSGNNTVSVRMGDGAGGFSGATNVAVGSEPRSVAVADVNGDGKLDLLAANATSGTVSVRLGDGAGGFSGTTELGLGGAGSSVVAADVNGDGRLDLLVANNTAAAVTVILNASVFPAPFDAASIASAAGAATGRAVDTAAPAAPVLSLSADTGASGTDKITNNAQTLPSGIEQGATLSYVVDGGQAIASYDPTTLADGAHTVFVTQTDLAGNVSAGGALAFTLDRIAPAAPVLALASDTGASSADRITGKAALKLSGLEAGATRSYSVDGGAASATFDPARLGQGRHTVAVTQTDLAGNVSAAGSLAFTLDTRGPTVAGVAVTGPGLAKGAGMLTTAERAVFKLTLSEAVTKVAAAAPATLTLSNGATARFLASASDAKHLAFAYTVKLEDTAADLAVKSVELDGAVLKDLAGNAAKLGGAVGNPSGKLTVDGFTGTKGADSFAAKSGAQTMRGLAGNDSYAVDSKGDRIVELARGGTDKVLASVSYALAANVEALTLTGKGKIAATGNGLANALSGNNAANTLSGLGGDDTLKGFGGTDRLVGGAGADKLYGGDGKKGIGADVFVFTALSDSTVSTKGRDTIFDFGADDRIDLSAIDANGRAKGSAAFTFIGTDKFHGTAGELRFEKLKSDTYVYADTNGDKQADMVIHLDDAVALTKAMFVL